MKLYNNVIDTNSELCPKFIYRKEPHIGITVKASWEMISELNFEGE